VISDCFEQSAGEKFLEVMGLERASWEVMRRQDLATVDRTHLDGLYSEVEAKAADYELVRLSGAAPADMLDDIGRLAESINDAPTDELDIEDEAFPADRVRAMEEAQFARGRRHYRLLARHRSTGELAGHTVVVAEIEQPWVGWQLDTSVARHHRGHRLGVLLKIAMLQWLRETEPQLRSLITWNAAANSHMVGINERLGYDVLANGIGWQRRI
jgi:GNAT superfamily N-acetyltransferase